MRFNVIKKILVLLGAASIISLSNISPLRAQAASTDIATILNQILAKVNTLPAALTQLSTFISAWTNPPTSTDPSAVMQGTFTNLGNLLTSDMTTQSSMQTALNGYMLNNDGTNVYNFNAGQKPTASQATSSALPYANDLVYSSLIGIPYTKETRKSTTNQPVDSALNYLINASGQNLYHTMPLTGWSGKPATKIRYQGFYNTVMAASSFNNYILSNNYADKAQFNTLQQTLIQQASDPTAWFAKIGSENIGLVLRQLLLFQSQVFVLLTQVVQLQKQMVTAQAMNTAVMIAVNQQNECILSANAQGIGAQACAS